GLGPEVAPGLHEAELRYLCRREWARGVNDVLWRRSKLGLHYSAEQRTGVERWLVEHAD
ncbi:MAG: glycerol-3-phosphate dehydrogenase, partial [Burkholderiaceae bacterium]